MDDGTLDGRSIATRKVSDKHASWAAGLPDVLGGIKPKWRGSVVHRFEHGPRIQQVDLQRVDSEGDPVDQWHRYVEERGAAIPGTSGFMVVDRRLPPGQADDKRPLFGERCVERFSDLATDSRP